MNPPAIVTLTPHGQNLGRRIVQATGGEVIAAAGQTRAVLSDLFLQGRPLVCIMSLGIVVRILGPLTQDKRTDPPVVVVDEAGRFVISVLGGHEAGANDMTRTIAAALGAIPVITTASDVLGLPALDLIGRDGGWKIEGADALPRVMAAMIRGEPIGVYQDAGQPDWWQRFGEWPNPLKKLESWPPGGEWAGVLAITDRVLPIAEGLPTVIYRPPSLVLGVGCRRGVPCAEIEAAFQEVCQAEHLSAACLGIVATVDLKADEPGLQEFAARHAVPLQAFPRAAIATVKELPSPSQQVRERIGVWGVAEPAALLAAGCERLLMPKRKWTRITMALARREHA